MQKTKRDEAMLEWLAVVRMAGMPALRYALAGVQGLEQPVSLRRAQWWVSRMISVGLVGRTRVNYRSGSIVWPTFTAVGAAAPNLFRQTTRHEITVAEVSARYLAKGYSWRRDRKPTSWIDHQGDGIATRGNQVDLIEVELSPKTPARYKPICENHAYRMAHEGFSRVLYLCTADAARTVSREADRFIFRDLRSRLEVVHVFNDEGNWIAGDDVLNLATPASTEPILTNELDGLELGGLR